MCYFLGQSLATNLVIEPKVTIFLIKINIATYFKNLTVELHILYTLNTHVKFYVNQILFTI